ncbi:MAG: polysaccharide biosynthesis protein [Lachnospiraceae bacterium]|nr:polysaccharide biosynthesis protein [Lachnospiraceae bacterium]
MLRNLAKGTLILTVTGLITRVIGFIYKIYLSNVFDGETLGIYQLIFPVYGICFTIYAAGIQPAISQMIAGKKDNPVYIKEVVKKACLLSLIISLVLSFCVYIFSDQIAIYMLGTSGCSSYLKMLSFSFPFCGIAACISGFYYGLRETKVPALTQLIEQIIKVIYVYIIIAIVGNENQSMTCMAAVSGIVFGELVSMVYSIANIRLYYKINLVKTNENKITFENNTIMSKFLKLSVPLTGNRLVIALLHGVETIMIPTMLKVSGMTQNEALSTYGALTGMALPFILFPQTITNSLSVLLLPAVSEAGDDKKKINRMSNICISFSMLFGVFSTIVFYFWGSELGGYVFRNDDIGRYIEIISFLCPFLFTATTLSSIINGLGYTHITFLTTIAGLFIRIMLTIKLVPIQGISGYLVSLLISEVAVSLFSYIFYNRKAAKL